MHLVDGHTFHADQIVQEVKARHGVKLSAAAQSDLVRSVAGALRSAASATLAFEMNEGATNVDFRGKVS